MQILQRLARICQADIHGWMDIFEDKELLLKQYMRDMAAALAQKEDRQKRNYQSREVVAQRLSSINREIKKIERDLEASLKHNKDIIARLLVKKLLPLSGIGSELENHIDLLDRKINQLQAVIDRQRHQLEQLKLRATEFIERSKPTELNGAFPDFMTDGISRKISDEVIELELMQRKEALLQNKGDRSK